MLTAPWSVRRAKASASDLSIVGRDPQFVCSTGVCVRIGRKVGLCVGDWVGVSVVFIRLLLLVIVFAFVFESVSFDENKEFVGLSEGRVTVGETVGVFVFTAVLLFFVFEWNFLDDKRKEEEEALDALAGPMSVEDCGRVGLCEGDPVGESVGRLDGDLVGV